MTASKQHNQRLIPSGSQAENARNPIRHALDIIRNEGLFTFVGLIVKRIYWELIRFGYILRFKGTMPKGAKVITLGDIHINPPASPHQTPVDIFIYIHNSTAGIKECVESVQKNTPLPYQITLVADGSDEETRQYLAGLSDSFPIVWQDRKLGYPQALSQGLQVSMTEFAVLLNSNIRVTPGWLDGMLACMQSNPKIGLVGPLTNRSIDLVRLDNRSTINPARLTLPENSLPNPTGELISRYSRRIYPPVNKLDDRCLLVRRQMIDQPGVFKEDDWLRVVQAGWQTALVDSAYVNIVQADHTDPDNSHEKLELPGTLLAKDEEHSDINEGKTFSRQYRVLDGIYWHNRHIAERENLIRSGGEHFGGRRVLFILPVKGAGGGSNSVFLAVQAMRKMGVDAQIMNLSINRPSFVKSYPAVEVPILFGEMRDISDMAASYDALVATSNITVSWIAPALAKRSDLRVGYYIQDYEPYFYRSDSEGYRIAAASYNLIADQVRCVTNQWIYDQIEQHHGISSDLVGGHIDTDLFRPMPLPEAAQSNQPLRIAAMIRPSSERRNPRMTMQILQQASKLYGSKLEFLLFGCEPYDPGFAPLPKNFPWQLAGELRPAQIVNLLNQSDIFVDYSVFQGFGLTAIESMCCGLATIVPSHGGSGAFARHEENCLVVDTQDQDACFKALQRSIEDDTLRQKLQKNAISTGVQFYPELPAYNILKGLFPEEL